MGYQQHQTYTNYRFAFVRKQNGTLHKFWRNSTHTHTLAIILTHTHFSWLTSNIHEGLFVSTFRMGFQVSRPLLEKKLDVQHRFAINSSLLLFLVICFYFFTLFENHSLFLLFQTEMNYSLGQRCDCTYRLRHTIKQKANTDRINTTIKLSNVKFF